MAVEPGKAVAAVGTFHITITALSTRAPTNIPFSVFETLVVLSTTEAKDLGLLC